MTPISGEEEFELRKVLIDAGAMVNLMLAWTALKTMAEIVPDQSLVVKGYDERTMTVKGYCWLGVKILRYRQRRLR